MTILTEILNGSPLEDVRLTLNALLADVRVLKAGGTVAPGPLTASVAGIGVSVLAGQYADGHTALGQMNLGSGVAVLNTGVPGEPLSTSLDRLYRGSVAAARSTSRTAILFVQSGTNDLADNGGSATADALYAGALVPAVAAGKAQGFYVAVCTLLPRKAGVFGWSAAQEAQRVAYNQKVRANAAGADYVLDLAAHPVMGDAADNTSNTTYYYDGVHPTAAGQDQLATGAYSYASAVQAIGAAYPTPRPAGQEAGAYVRLGALANMTEAANGGGYDYACTGNPGYGPAAGVGVAPVTLAVGTVGWAEMVIPGQNANGPILGLQTAPSFGNYTSIDHGVFYDGGLAVLSAGTSVTPNGDAFVAAAGDRVRVRRALTGTFVEATRDGAVWTKVHSFGGDVSKFYIVGMSPGSGAGSRIRQPRASLSAV